MTTKEKLCRNWALTKKKTHNKHSGDHSEKIIDERKFSFDDGLFLLQVIINIFLSISLLFNHRSTEEEKIPRNMCQR